MAIRVRRVGHVVLKVRDLERSVRFYRDVLGLTEVARFRGRMAFFRASGDNHHDIALLEVGPEAPLPRPREVGLYHVALQIGDHLEELAAAKAQLDAHGVRIAGVIDHRVSRSIYLNDPDGNGLELYVDGDPALWRDDPASVAYAEPMEL